MKAALFCMLFVSHVSSLALGQTAECRQVKFELQPNEKDQTACQGMRLQGEAVLEICGVYGAQVSVGDLAPYPLKASEQGWISKNEFTDDETRTSYLSLLILDTQNQTYSGKLLVTDRRGHRLSSRDCAGRLQVK